MKLHPGPLTVGADINLSKLKSISNKSDFPPASNGVITLADNTGYIISGSIDLVGDRIVSGENTVLFGLSPEYSILKSTGFDDSNGAFITSEYTIAINLVGFHDFGTEQVLNIDGDLNGNANTVAIDWYGVNFSNCSNIGVIKDVDNFIANTMGVLSSAGLTFDGTIGTIAFQASIFTFFSSGTIITIPSTATITRRFRIIYSAVVVGSSATALNINASATIPDEGYILDVVNFSGSGTYQTGLTKASEKALFVGCRGISNTATIGHCYMTDNATTTSATTAGTFYKIAGTTTVGDVNEKFTHSSNRLTYSGALAGFFQITASVNVATSTNTDFSFRAAKNGTTSASGEITVRQQSNNAYSSAVVQDVFEMETDDYIEIFVSASQNSATIEVPDLNILVKRLTE